MKIMVRSLVFLMIGLCYSACNRGSESSSHSTNPNAPTPNTINIMDLTQQNLIRTTLLPESGGIVRGMTFGDPLKKVIDTVEHYSLDGKAFFRPQYEHVRIRPNVFSKDSIKIISVDHNFYEGPVHFKGSGYVTYELINDKLFSITISMSSGAENASTDKNVDKAFTTLSEFLTSRFGQPGYDSKGDDLDKPLKEWRNDNIFIRMKYNNNGIEISFYKSSEDWKFRNTFAYGGPPEWVLLPNQSISDFK